MANNNRKTEIDSTNMELAEFSIHTKTSLVDSICKTRHKWVIDYFTKCSNNNLNTLFIMNIGVESATYIEESLTVCRCHVDEIDRPDIDDIDHVNKDVISLWQEIICRGSQQTKVDTNMDMDYNHYESNLSGYPNSSMRILELISGKIEILEEYLTKVKSIRLAIIYKP